MSYTFSGFTAGMTTPKAYFAQIIGYIPDTLDFMYTQLNRKIVVIFALLGTILGFLFFLLSRVRK